MPICARSKAQFGRKNDKAFGTTMALFTDGPLISTEDLQKCENSIPNLASIESIDLAVKIALAQGEIANQLVLFLLRRLPLRDFVNFPWAQRTRDVGDVVVTEPLRQWH